MSYLASNTGLEVSGSPTRSLLVLWSKSHKTTKQFFGFHTVFMDAREIIEQPPQDDSLYSEK
jgi:hypothetical protein